jgi:polyisoprenoid-binding protein YceI
MASLSEFFSDPSSAGTWTAVPDQSSIDVKAKSFWGVLPVKGQFTEFSGDGQIAAPQTVFGRLDIKAGSLKTGIRKRDEHMYSADFFEAEKYPDISVEVTAGEPVDGETIALRAQLTIKGTTKPVDLTTKVTPVGDGGMRLQTTTTVNRQDFGVDGNLVGMVGDNATISADVVFRRTDA